MKRLRSMADAMASAQTRPIGGVRGSLLTLGIAVVNQAMHVGATRAFALSGLSGQWKDFLIWQLVGSAFGLGTQLTFAGLVRFSSVQLACAISIGLAFVTTEFFNAFKFFHESFSRLQWVGVALVGAGLLLLAWGKS